MSGARIPCVQASDLVEIALRRGFSRLQTDAALRSLNEEQVCRLAWACRWADTRHEHQIVPADEEDGPWSVWLILGGRGAGKTRVGAEWLGMAAATAGLDRNGQPFRGLVAAPTNIDLEGTCFEGESGLLTVIPTSLVQDYNINKHRLRLHNGSIVGGISAEKSSRFRGPQWHRAWCDELAAWGDNGRDPQEAWDTMALSVRLGDDTRILATTTPRPLPHIKALLADAGTVVSTASTYINLDNLSGEFAKRILKYEGTKIGRQEIHAELIDSEEGGIVKRSDLKLWAHDKPLPLFEFIVMSLDTAYSEESYDKKRNETDPSASSTWGCFRVKGKPGIMLLDCWAEKLGLPDLVEKVRAEFKHSRYGEDDKRPWIVAPGGVKRALTTGHGVDMIVIEEKASGKSLIQYLAKAGINAWPFNPGKADKLTRLHVVSPLPVNGTIWVPESKTRPGKPMTWAEPLIEQICSFSGEGTVLHDDLLDTTTQAWRIIDWKWLHYLEAAAAAKKARKGGNEDHAPEPAPKVNPYSR